MSELAIESNTLKNNAHQNPSMRIPSTILAASNTMSTFNTIKKIPNVNMVMGSVRKMSNGFNIAFKNASTRQKTNDVV